MWGLSGTLAHIHSGWSIPRFNNVCEFKISHFFTLRLHSVANASLVDRIFFITFTIT